MRSLDGIARRLARRGITADALTFLGLAVGWAAAGAIAVKAFWAGAALILVSRLVDGLDGAVARATAPTDRGGFLDISLDFLFYPAIPLAFAMADSPGGLRQHRHLVPGLRDHRRQAGFDQRRRSRKVVLLSRPRARLACPPCAISG